MCLELLHYLLAQRPALGLAPAQVGRSLDLYLGEAGFEELVASKEIDAFVRCQDASRS